MAALGFRKCVYVGRGKGHLPHLPHLPSRSVFKKIIRSWNRFSQSIGLYKFGRVQAKMLSDWNVIVKISEFYHYSFNSSHIDTDVTRYQISTIAA